MAGGWGPLQAGPPEGVLRVHKGLGRPREARHPRPVWGRLGPIGPVFVSSRGP